MKKQLQELINTNQNFTRYLKSPKANKDLVAYVNSFNGESLVEKIYVALNGNVDHTCKECGNDTSIISVTKGYRKFCDLKCTDSYNRKTNGKSAIDKLHTFGNFQYISGYENTHSKILVRNTKCGHEFTATYLNLFTNPNYCSFCGVEDRREKLVNNNKNKWTLGFKEKIIEKHELKRREKNELVKLHNEIIENEVIINENYSVFLTEFRDKHLQHTDKKLKLLFPKIYAKVVESNGESFWEKYFNLVNPNHVHNCLNCGNPTNFNKNNYMWGYYDFCGIGCVSSDEGIQEKIKQTSIIKYGVEHHLQNTVVMEKRYQTNIDKYGVSSPMQNKVIQTKAWKSQYRLKDVILPSGRVVKLMGYEPQVVKHLLATRYTESDMSFNEIPTFKYDGNHLYFPDLYIPKEKRVIEVKSEWTYSQAKEITHLKGKAVVDAGFTFELIIWEESKK